jgi:uncharacterized membrane protein YkoI
MREKLTRIILTAAGVAALAGGTIAVTDAAVAKGKTKHAKKHKANKAAELTGDTKTQAEAAALAAVPGGEVERSFEAKADNPDGAKYVVRVEKDDDTHVNVLEDASFNVLEVVEAKAKPPCGGDHGGVGGPHPRPEALTGDTKTQAEAAALAAVPGGQVEDSHVARPDNPDNAAYAVRVEKEDDSYVIVLEDSSFNVIKVIDAPEHGRGGPGGGHGHHGPKPPPADEQPEGDES